MDGGARRRLPSWMLGAADAEPSKKSNNGDKTHTHKVGEERVCSRPSKTRKKALNASAVSQGDRDLGGTSHDHSKDEGEPAPVRVRSKTRRQCDKDALLQESRTLGATAHGRSKATRKRDRDALGQENQTLGTSSLDDMKGKRKRSKRTSVGEQDAECNLELASSREQVNLSGRIVQISSIRGKTNMTSNENAQPLAAGVNDEELTEEDLLSFARECLEGAEDEKQPEPSGRQHELETENFETANGFVNFAVHHSKNAAVSAHETTTNDTSEGVENKENTTSTPMTGDPAQDMLELLLGPLLRKPAEENKTERIMKDTALRKDFEMQSRNDGREVVPAVKKSKKSLRDEVALLLEQ